jgi:hypothetical protein
MLVVDPAAIHQAVLPIQKRHVWHAIDAEGGANLLVFILHDREAQFSIQGERGHLHDGVSGRAKHTHKLNAPVSVAGIERAQFGRNTPGHRAFCVEKYQRESLVFAEVRQGAPQVADILEFDIGDDLADSTPFGRSWAEQWANRYDRSKQSHAPHGRRSPIK